MAKKNQFMYGVKNVVLIACLSLIGCDPDSTGNKDSEQLNNDNDPTNIEIPAGQDSLQMNDTNEIGKMDNNGEIVVIQNFEDGDWEKISQDLKLTSDENFSTKGINSKYAGAESWKTWRDYEYRIVYFSDNGSLKAKPIVRTKGNADVQISTQSIDSLGMGELWNEIQGNLTEISSKY